MKPIFLVAVSALLLMGLTILSYGEDKKKDSGKETIIKEIQSDFQLLMPITDTRLIPTKGYPTFSKSIPSGVFWPDEKIIKENRMEISNDFSAPLEDAPNRSFEEAQRLVREWQQSYSVVSVKSAIQDTKEWINESLKSEWIPQDIDRRMIPLRQSYLGDVLEATKAWSEYGVLCDAVWLRYETGRYYIQIVSVSNELKIFIRLSNQEENRKSYNKDNINNMIMAKTEEFLLEGDKLKQTFNVPTGKEVGWVGKQDSEKLHKIRKSLNNKVWLVDWWTDGDVMMFSIAKDNAEPICKNWFAPLGKPDKDKKDDSLHDKDKDKEHKDKGGKDDKSNQPDKKDK